jgi:hypothetical protein
MQNFNRCLLLALFVLAFGGAMAVVDRPVARAIADEKRAGDHWQNFDGHWSFWHEGDKRWYYTDGVHWYYHNGAGWVLYQFDKLFGLSGFHHGDYKVPGPEIKVPVPTHGVYHG